jgi:hypothetical protein
MDPAIRIGAAAVGAVLLIGGLALGRLGRSSGPHAVPSDTGTDEQPSWVGRYTAMAFGAMLVVGGLTVDAAFAVLAFVVVLLGLSGYKIASNIRRGGYGGEE